LWIAVTADLRHVLEYAALDGNGEEQDRDDGRGDGVERAVKGGHTPK
jgi:hypothetical protein